MGTHYLITSNPETFGIEWTSGLTWGGGQVWGPAAPEKHTHFPTRESAELVFKGIEPRAVRFYSLVVLEVPAAPRYIEPGHGWMVGHPGYDLA